MFKELRKLFTPPVILGDAEKTLAVRSTFIVIMCIFGIELISVPLQIYLGNTIGETSVVIVSTVLAFVALISVQRDRLTFANYLIVLAMLLVVYGHVYFSGGIQRPVFLIVFIVLPLAALLLRGWQIIGVTVAMIALTVLLYALQKSGQLINVPPAPLENTLILGTFAIIAASAFLLITSNTLLTALERARRTEKDILEKNEELQTFSEGLETLVGQRTTELQTASLQLERRAAQFRAIAEISRSVTALQDVDSLLSMISSQISLQFNVYHVGIFLLDVDRDFAVLRASNSEGGQRMMARGHRLRVGAQGIVGYVTQRGKARIALDTGIDATYFNNPDLPHTRSEAALPLIIGGEVIGALDVQSEQPSAFNEGDVEVLGVLADQVAIAIQNARLYAQTTEALREAQQTTRARIQSDWERFAGRAENLGYQLTGASVEPLRQRLQTEELTSAAQTGEVETSPDGLGIPIKLRGETIGVIGLKARGATRQWTESELATARAAAERVALAIENARLVEESQRRATLERLTSDIAGKIGTSLRFETILRTAAEEISRALSGSEVLVQIQPESFEGGQSEKAD